MTTSKCILDLLTAMTEFGCPHNPLTALKIGYQC